MPVKRPPLLKTAALVSFAFLTGCTLNFPREEYHAELFLPMIPGFEGGNEEGFEYTRDSHAYRISKALEQQYLATVLENIELRHYCSGEKPLKKQEDIFL